jgi:hypothetical protein
MKRYHGATERSIWCASVVVRHPKKKKRISQPVQFLASSPKNIWISTKVQKRPTSMRDPTGVKIGGRRDQNMHGLEVFDAALVDPNLRAPS